MCGSRGRRAGGVNPPPPEKTQNIGVSGNTGLDPLKNHKATKPAFNVRPDDHRHASKTPFKWRFAARPMMAPFILSSLKTSVVKVGPPLT